MWHKLTAFNLFCSLVILLQNFWKIACISPGVTRKELSKSGASYKIVGPVLYSTTTSEAHCEIYCHGSDDCWAYNYNKVSQSCELMKSCSQGNSFSLKQSSSWAFKAQNCRVANLCARNGTTDSEGNCICPFPWKGKLCEEYDGGNVKQNSGPVCFGARDEKFGRFYTSHAGKISYFKFVHISGGVAFCCSSPGNWGTTRSSSSSLEMYIANSARQKLYPTPDMTIYSTNSGGSFHYKLPGQTNMSPELTLSKFSPPLDVTAGMELRLYFAQDFMDEYESDNSGTSCTDVYAFYV